MGMPLTSSAMVSACPECQGLRTMDYAESRDIIQLDERGFPRVCITWVKLEQRYVRRKGKRYDAAYNL